MSDSNSAEIYSDIFEFLATMRPGPKRTAAAKKFWKASFDYDFHPDEMYAYSSLIALGLAVQSRHPESGEVLLYYADSDCKRFSR